MGLKQTTNIVSCDSFLVEWKRLFVGCCLNTRLLFKSITISWLLSFLLTLHRSCLVRMFAKSSHLFWNRFKEKSIVCRNVAKQLKKLSWKSIVISVNYQVRIQYSNISLRCAHQYVSRSRAGTWIRSVFTTSIGESVGSRSWKSKTTRNTRYVKFFFVDSSFPLFHSIAEYNNEFADVKNQGKRERHERRYFLT